MNFNIIDGNNDWINLTPTFIELYNNPEITVPKIRETLKITNNEYRKLRKHCIENNYVSKRKTFRPKKRTYKTDPKYYSPTTTRGITYFRVAKHINGHYTYFCEFKKAQQAELMVEKLKECDWDKSQVDRLKSEVLSECP